jgi:tetraacyldisaccharide 4'-kinase
MTKDYILPYGELRESVKNMYRADIIIITKTPRDISQIQRQIIAEETASAPWQNLYFTAVEYEEPVSVFTGSSNNIFKSGKREERGILLVTGIARADTVKEYLGKYASEIIHLNYSDHHNFSENDISRIIESFDKIRKPDKYIITTEKDAVRFREFVNIADAMKSSFFYIPIGINFLNGDRNEFDNLIIEYVRKNKRDGRIP